ncbi:thioredoxin family protein [Magnetococcus sp. PR-3]|uniref:thioredoxin family protein n=1 Tax=Magnetococcus sp. PR-3 TaxID=3120355 RepID=UPI002FCE2684
MRYLFTTTLLLGLLWLTPTPAQALVNEPFFQDSFLDMGEDAATAADEGKIFMVFYEQEACPYCDQLHKQTLPDPGVKSYMKAHFYPVLLDIYGAREVTDFQGKATKEKAFARSERVHFTPTVIYYDGKGQELFRLSGYWKPMHFKASMRYVKEGHYKNKNFQDLIRQIVQEQMP